VKPAHKKTCIHRDLTLRQETVNSSKDIAQPVQNKDKRRKNFFVTDCTYWKTSQVLPATEMQL
jgi:hypothetical protein